MEEYDAFSGGVEPGGLRSKNDIKNLICYLVNRLDTPLTKDQLNDVIAGTGIANYFEVNQALCEVIENGNVFMHDDYYLFITDLGKKNAAILEEDLPYTIREQAFNAAVRLQTRLRRERENLIDIEHLAQGCNITVSVLDGDDKLMSVTLYVADSEQAQAVKEKFLADPVNVYSTIVALLMA